MREYEIEQQEMYYDGMESIYGNSVNASLECGDVYKGFDVCFLIDTYGVYYKSNMGGLSLVEEDYEKWLCNNKMAY